MPARPLPIPICPASRLLKTGSNWLLLSLQDVAALVFHHDLHLPAVDVELAPVGAVVKRVAQGVVNPRLYSADWQSGVLRVFFAQNSCCNPL